MENDERTQEEKDAIFRAWQERAERIKRASPDGDRRTYHAPPGTTLIVPQGARLAERKPDRD